MKFVALLAFGVAMNAAAQTAAPPHKMHHLFNLEEVLWFGKNGKGTIKGSAAITTKSGEVHSCAGLGVELLPASHYAVERVETVYKNSERGKVLVADGPPIAFIPDTPEYHSTARKTTCDASGQFEFTNLPVGDYFVFAFIIWEKENKTPDGGVQMQRVKLKKNATEILKLN